MAVPTDAVAEVPTGVDLADAAALPMAGVTALRTVRSRDILGRRVLITGAAGGVGRYAVQLAALGGAHVIASVGSPARAQGLAELGASQVVVGLTGIDRPIDLILDKVGGPQLAAAWALLAEGGVIRTIGSASEEAAVFEPYSLFSLSRPKRSAPSATPTPTPPAPTSPLSSSSSPKAASPRKSPTAAPGKKSNPPPKLSSPAR
ncbi:zinc-binding dehydrogenase [Spongiactinospora sp. TRM90649]|uniref:zinc-binding dehydrogenase n=1 Tax=Spongiactinospora sp. TRM90649 TaxID=3031114 RepID=UPI0023F73B40|nr:zinc-binding dehydrogenase [Spongiactinospora sp. TRM90649]MDF5751177.1 zinc-binding dehydrogenase [Spongiactinospora sp. TRM90649]